VVITAAYTGMRWGELAGLAKANTHLGDGLISIHPEVGALHEVGGHLYPGPPKSAASIRDIHPPPFLVDLLQDVDSHDHDLVFCGAWLRRSAMTRTINRSGLSRPERDDVEERSNPHLAVARAWPEDGAGPGGSRRELTPRDDARLDALQRTDRFGVMILCSHFAPHVRSNNEKSPLPLSWQREPTCGNFGGRYWDRTSDLSGVNGALSR
jgi:hypothetical protein